MWNRRFDNFRESLRQAWGRGTTWPRAYHGGGEAVQQEGWTYGDLAGELYARGIDIDDVPTASILKAKECATSAQAAQQIEGEGGDHGADP